MPARLEAWRRGFFVDQHLQKLRSILERFERSPEPFSECELSDAVQKVLRERAPSSTDPPLELLAEAMAFSFCEDYQDERTGWGTYYGPSLVSTNENGTTRESPRIRLISSSMLKYWSDRAVDTKHPAMKNRYADLVWDFSREITGEPPRIGMAHLVIDSAVEIMADGRSRYEGEVDTLLRRALTIALSISDSARILQVRDAIIGFAERDGSDDHLFCWIQAFDLLVDHPKIQLEDAQKAKIVDGIEDRLAKAAGSSGSQFVDPNAAEMLTIRLRDYYRKHDRLDDVHRVLRLCGTAHLEWAGNAEPMLGAIWVNKMFDLYLSAGMKADADSLVSQMRDLGERANSAMKVISLEESIPQEKVKQYLQHMTEGSLEDVLARIAAEYIPDPKVIERQVKKMAISAPLMSLVTQEIHDYKGRPIAQVGSVESDIEGRVVLQMSQNMHFAAYFLRMSLETMISKFRPCSETFLELFLRSPLFDPDLRKIMIVGLDAYLQDNHIVTAHVLIPQVEIAVRRVMELSEGPVYKKGRSGGIYLKSLDEMLREKSVVSILSDRIAKYFRVLLTDSRGWNARNNICHGMVNVDCLGSSLSDRLLHVLFVLSLFRNQAPQDDFDLTNETPDA